MMNWHFGLEHLNLCRDVVHKHNMCYACMWLTSKKRFKYDHIQQGNYREAESKNLVSCNQNHHASSLSPRKRIHCVCIIHRPLHYEKIKTMS